MQLFQDGQSLLLGAVLQNPLDNSAAIRVCGEHKHLINNNKKKRLRTGGEERLCVIHLSLMKTKAIYLTCPLKASIMN